MIYIVGLGMEKGDLTLRGLELMTSGRRVLLRTERHPAARLLQEKGIAYTALDDVYDNTQDFDQVNARIAERVLAAGDCVYAVPGGAGLMDATVSAVVRAANQAGQAVEVAPGVGEAETAAAKAGSLEGAVLCAAIDYVHRVPDPRQPLILVELDKPTLASEVKLRLLDFYPSEHTVFFRGKAMPLMEVDRQADYDHTAALVVPPLALMEAERYDFYHLAQVIEKLRAPGGCPWDREQTHESLKPNLVEECYEVLDAIGGDDPLRLADELGDVLLQVVMHAQIAKEHGEFDLMDVTTAVCHKMITRHPHIFGDVQVAGTEDVLRNWEQIKRKEKDLKSNVESMLDVPASFPALMRAEKVQKKVRHVGIDWGDAQWALSKVREETEEVAQELAHGGEGLAKELGDLLFAVVNACRLSHVPPELALHQAAEKYIRRVGRLEELVKEAGLQLEGLPRETLDDLWKRVKAQNLDA